MFCKIALPFERFVALVALELCFLTMGLNMLFKTLIVKRRVVALLALK